MERVPRSLIIVVSIGLAIAACSQGDTRCAELMAKLSSCGLDIPEDCNDALLARYDQIMNSDCSVLRLGKADGFDAAGLGRPDSSVPDDASVEQAADSDGGPEPDAQVAQPDLGPQTVCGDGVREGDEQCDDGNTTNLDGCDGSCRFEQSQRVNYLVLKYGTDSFCGSNAFGTALAGQLVRDTLQQVIDDSIKDGVTSILYKMMDLDDLTGSDDPSVVMGWMSGNAVQGSGYDGTDDLDWWYLVDPGAIDAQRDPLALVTGSISSGVLTAGPGNLTVGLDFAGSMGYLDLSNAKIVINIGASSTPLASGGGTPGHLAGENLDPALASFESAGSKSSTGAGKLCGAISASSLDQVPIPSTLMSYCTPTYTANDSMLDVMIGGCSVFFYGQLIKPTQPDAEDPTVPPAGAGPPYTIYSYAGGHTADGCKASDGQKVSKTACFKDAAYSSYMRFASGRVIIK